MQYRSELAAELRQLRKEGKRDAARGVREKRRETEVYRKAELIHRGVHKGVVKIFSDIAQKNTERKALSDESGRIHATTPEGEEVIFDIEQERLYWTQFYKTHNLPQLVTGEDGKELIPAYTTLSPEKMERIRGLIEKYGYNRMMFCPPVSVQDRNLFDVKKEMGKKVESLDEQYNRADDGIMFFDGVKNALKKGELTTKRKNLPYIKLWRDDAEVEMEEKSALDYQGVFEGEGINGDTLFEYLIAQRDIVERTKKHPESETWVWLLDSIREIKDRGELILIGQWASGMGKVLIREEHPSYSDSCGGAHKSSIIYLD